MAGQYEQRIKNGVLWRKSDSPLLPDDDNSLVMVWMNHCENCHPMPYFAYRSKGRWIDPYDNCVIDDREIKWWIRPFSPYGEIMRPTPSGRYPQLSMDIKCPAPSKEQE